MAAKSTTSSDNSVKRTRRTTKRSASKTEAEETLPTEQAAEAQSSSESASAPAEPAQGESAPPVEKPRRKRVSKKAAAAEGEAPAKSKKTSEPESDFGEGLVDLPSEGPSRSVIPTREAQPAAETPPPAEERATRSRQTEAPRREPEPAPVNEAPQPTGDDSRTTASGEREDSGDEGSPGRRRRRRRRGSRKSGQPQQGQQPQRDRRQDQGRGPGKQQQQKKTPRPTKTAHASNEGEVTGKIQGVLELHPKGYGFLRDPNKNYASQEDDAFVSSSLVEKYQLRPGVMIYGDVGPGSKGQGPRLKGIDTVDGRPPEDFLQLRMFDDLTPINPDRMIKLERGPEPITMRVMDLLTPIGKGQRALIVAPPRTGKTMLLQDIADSVSYNHPEVHLIVLLIDERPEEVTEMKRRVKGEVIASSMDREVESHIRISQLIFERAKRLAEGGKDVFVLLDSITRTARAFNKWIGNSGQAIMSGGMGVKAMDIPKKMFGTARQFDEGGSLTVLGTALIDTGSRMDEVIFQEFKGTGNMELVLSRDLSDRRIFPSIDISQSGTRREEKILDPEVLEGVTMLRRSLISMSPVEAMEQLINTLKKFKTNADFLAKIRAVL